MATLEALLAHYFNKCGYQKTLAAFREECDFKERKKLKEDLESIFNKYKQRLSEADASEKKPKEKRDNDGVSTEAAPNENHEKKGKKGKKKKAEDLNVIDEKTGLDEALDEKKPKNDTSKRVEDVANEKDEKVASTKPKKGKKKKAEDLNVMDEKTGLDEAADEKKPKNDTSKRVEDLANGKDEKVASAKQKKGKKEKKKKAEGLNVKDEKTGDEVADEKKLKNDTNKRVEDLAKGNDEKVASVKETSDVKLENGKTNEVNGEIKSSRKRKRGDAETNGEDKVTGTPFQRVKEDVVEFRDDRLKDNSYWAKDEAGLGWGAKAQEVLGQVKGKGFRHEKTKKKRGTYRGGAIDMQSHSIKFESDDE